MANFYRWQEQARRSTIRLVFSFLLAVTGTTLAMSLVGAALLPEYSPTFAERTCDFIPIFAALILGTSFLRTILLLIGGGRSIGKRLGGTPLDMNSENVSIKERQLRNVVEEMSIASAISMPQIYVLQQELGINAFAAGLSKDAAVIGITRGAVELLNREQLQGVIAHEFSHIVNGDMRLNVLLAGVLFGLLGPLALFSARSTLSRFLSSIFARRKRNSNPQAALGLGAILVIQFLIGAIGFICASFIKAQINKQREFLADASAVQFTRNSAGLAGALKTIGGYSRNSQLRKCNSVEFSHLFIAESYLDITLQSSFFSDVLTIFGTHPPLAKRILQLEPNWDGTFPYIVRSQAARQQEVDRAWIKEGLIAASAGLSAFSNTTNAPVAVPLPSLFEQIKILAQHSDTAPLIPILLLFDGTKTAEHFLYKDMDSALLERLKPLLHEKIPAEKRLPLLLSAIPAMQQLSTMQKEEYMLLFMNLSLSDHVLTREEWVVTAILGKYLNVYNHPVSLQKQSRKKTAAMVEKAIQIVFAEFAVESGGAYAPRLFTAALEKAGMALFPMPKTGQYNRLESALYQLCRALPQAKREALIKICHRMIAADKEVTPAEVELYQAVAALLNISVQPLKAGKIRS